MGDTRRFDAFGDFVGRNWPDRMLRIADVAGGKGGLHAALYQRGYPNVVTFDKRRNRANPARSHYRYGWFDESVTEPFDLILGMHPDEATDVAMAYALERGLPYAVVPCCVKPMVWPFGGHEYGDWLSHLARKGGSRQAALPITGRNVVLFVSA